jgi:hypothetical protein
MRDNYCIRCGTPITDPEAHFCAGCGGRLRVPPSPARRHGGVIAIVIAGASSLLVIGGVVWFMAWYTGDRAHSTHGVRFHVAGFDVERRGAGAARNAGTDWAVRLTPLEGAAGGIDMYGIRAGSHGEATRMARENFTDMESAARSDHASAVQGPEQVALLSDGTAMKETWQSPQGGGRFYTIAVGSQMIMLVCYDSAKAKPDVLHQCDRIAETISPA